MELELLYFYPRTYLSKELRYYWIYWIYLVSREPNQPHSVFCILGFFGGGEVTFFVNCRFGQNFSCRLIGDKCLKRRRFALGNISIPPSFKSKQIPYYYRLLFTNSPKIPPVFGQTRAHSIRKAHNSRTDKSQK